jgi:hypothetical protein
VAENHLTVVRHMGCTLKCVIRQLVVEQLVVEFCYYNLIHEHERTFGNAYLSRNE